jgi:ribosomal protein L29
MSNENKVDELRELTSEEWKATLTLLKDQFARVGVRLDTVGVKAGGTIDERIKLLVQQRDAAQERSNYYSNSSRMFKEERDKARAELKQIKQDLLATGRIQKLCCDLALGDASPEDVDEG